MPVNSLVGDNVKKPLFRTFLDCLLCVTAFSSTQHAVYVAARQKDGVFEGLKVQHSNVCNRAHDDGDHKVRNQASALWKNTHAVNGLKAVSERPYLDVRTSFTAASVNGRYTIVTMVSRRMFPFCSKASLPSATDEAEKSWATPG